jgi:hypothetical protein
VLKYFALNHNACVDLSVALRVKLKYLQITHEISDEDCSFLFYYRNLTLLLSLEGSYTLVILAIKSSILNIKSTIVT